jgi:hypothetical protein
MSPRAKKRSLLERILLALLVFVVCWIAGAGVLYIILRDLGFTAASLTWLNPVGAAAGLWFGYRVLRG